jgi:hypothetical protein
MEVTGKPHARAGLTPTRVGSRVGLDDVDKRKSLSLSESKMAVHPVTLRYID